MTNRSKGTSKSNFNTASKKGSGPSFFPAGGPVLAVRDCSSQLDGYISNADIIKISDNNQTTTPFHQTYVKRAGSTTSASKQSPFPANGGGNTSMGHSTAITKQSPNPNGDASGSNINS
jgi:hypothetical protein